MRLFTAVNFSIDVKNQLYDIINQMKPQVYKANFTRKENLHLTLVFIGEKTQSECSGIINCLNDVKFDPFTIRFDKTGRFRNLHWIGLKHSSELTRLQNNIAEVLDIKPDFDYKPHITLAREVVLENDLKLKVPPMDMEVNNFDLMKSERINGVLRYTAVTSHQASIQTQAGNV